MNAVFENIIFLNVNLIEFLIYFLSILDHFHAIKKIVLNDFALCGGGGLYPDLDHYKKKLFLCVFSLIHLPLISHFSAQLPTDPIRNLSPQVRGLFKTYKEINFCVVVGT